MVTREAGKPVNNVTPDLMCVVPTNIVSQPVRCPSWNTLLNLMDTTSSNGNNITSHNVHDKHFLLCNGTAEAGIKVYMTSFFLT